MASISSLGVGSGLDVTSLVSQLMAVEQQPLLALNSKKTAATEKISAYGSLNSALATLKTAATALNTPTKINAYKGTFSDTTFGTATVSSSATSGGTYDIAVTQLAKAHTLATASYTGGSATTVVGDGTLNITSGSNTFSLTIDSTNDTLGGIRDAINKSTANTSVSASIVTDANGAKLVLSAKNSGLANKISVAVTPSGGTGLNALSFTGGAYTMTEGNPAQNAELTVNGVAISSASNTVSTAITGVTFTLLKASSSSTLTVARDSSSISAVVSDFAKAYSTLNTTVKKLTAYDATSQTSSVLTGDSTATLLQTKLRSILSTVPSSLTGGTYTSLSQVGISIQSDGSMSVDSTKLQSAIDNHFSDFQSTLAAYGKAVSDAVGNLTGVNGAIAARITGLNSSVKTIEAQGERLSARLDVIEARYKKQFSALDSLMSKMSTTSSYLTQQLAKL